MLTYPSIVPAKTAVLQSGFIFEEGHFPSCHASTLAETPSGLVTAWFAGIREFDPGVGIWVARRQGIDWTRPIEVANGIQYWKDDGAPHRYACWNPVLHQVPGGPLMLFYKVGRSPQTWWGMVMVSHDDGETWATPIRLPEGIGGPVKNKPVQLENGNLLCPASTEETMATGWRVHFEITSDLGKTWKKTDAVNDGIAFGAIQPSILRHPGGRLQAVGRTQLAKRIFSVFSEDGGKTWGEITLLHVPNPDAGTDAVTMHDGRHALIYNHSTTVRSPLALAISEDGMEWKAAAIIDDLKGGPGELSYPAIIQSADGLLHVSYTWNRVKIKHAVIDPSRLALKSMDSSEWPKD